MADKILVIKYGFCDNYVFDLCTTLYESGFSTTLLLIHDRPGFTQPVFTENLKKLQPLIECVYVNQLSDPLHYPIQKTRGILHRFNRNHRWLGFSPLLVRKVRRAIRHRVPSFKKLIVFDQHGLYLTHRAVTESMAKVIYYSLEIYTPENPQMRESFMRSLVDFELSAIPSCAALIIQDKLRAQALLGPVFDQVESRIIYLPVSVKEKEHHEKSDYLFKQNKISDRQKILLYYGSLYKGRGIEWLLKSFLEIDAPGLSLFFHGYKRDAEITSASARVFVSSELLNFDEIYKIITSAYIGFAIYSNDDLNNRLTAFSSEKVARYTQCGVPFIAVRNESYEKLKTDFDCCELIDDYGQLESAIKKITGNYDQYRENAFFGVQEIF